MRYVRIIVSLLLISSALSLAIRVHAGEDSSNITLPASFYINNDTLIISSMPNNTRNNEDTHKSDLIIKFQPASSEKTLPFAGIAAIIVAFIALFSSIWVSWQNYKLTKRTKWYDTWSGKIDQIHVNIYKLCSDILASGEQFETARIRVSFLEIKSQLFTLINRHDPIIQQLDNIESQLLESNPYQQREAIYTSLMNLSKYFTEVIRNGI